MHEGTVAARAKLRESAQTALAKVKQRVSNGATVAEHTGVDSEDKTTKSLVPEPAAQSAQDLEPSDQLAQAQEPIGQLGPIESSHGPTNQSAHGSGGEVEAESSIRSRTRQFFNQTSWWQNRPKDRHLDSLTRALLHTPSGAPRTCRQSFDSGWCLCPSTVPYRCLRNPWRASGRGI